VGRSNGMPSGLAAMSRSIGTAHLHDLLTEIARRTCNLRRSWT